MSCFRKSNRAMDWTIIEIIVQMLLKWVHQNKSFALKDIKWIRCLSEEISFHRIVTWILIISTIVCTFNGTITFEWLRRWESGALVQWADWSCNWRNDLMRLLMINVEWVSLPLLSSPLLSSLLFSFLYRSTQSFLHFRSSSHLFHSLTRSLLTMSFRFSSFFFFYLLSKGSLSWEAVKQWKNPSLTTYLPTSLFRRGRFLLSPGGKMDERVQFEEDRVFWSTITTFFGLSWTNILFQMDYLGINTEDDGSMAGSDRSFVERGRVIFYILLSSN